jgi:hypothetical protein
MIQYLLMKRIAVTGFAVLYAVLVLGISVNRTAAWAESKASQNKSDQGTAFSVGKPSPPSSPYGKKRIPQNSFVVESPLIASGIILISNERAIAPTEGRLHGPFASNIPARAPPTLS